MLERVESDFSFGLMKTGGLTCGPKPGAVDKGWSQIASESLVNFDSIIDTNIHVKSNSKNSSDTPVQDSFLGPD